MPSKYTVKDAQGQLHTFDWHGTQPPNDSDIDYILREQQRLGAGPGVPSTGRASGAGPVGDTVQAPPPVSSSGPKQSWTDWGIDQLPAAGGMLGGLVGSPVGPLGAIGLASLGAAGGEGWRQTINAIRGHGVPLPPATALTQMGAKGLEYGTLPEVVGQGTGKAIEKVGDVVSRLRPSVTARNAAVIDKAANPAGMRMSEFAGEVGKGAQVRAIRNYRTTKDTLSQGYDHVLAGPLGRARSIALEEHGTQPYAFDQNPDTFWTPEGDAAQPPTAIGGEGDQFTAGEQGPTVKDIHDSRQMRNRRAAIQRIADENGISADQYMYLSDRWREMNEQFGKPNKFMRGGKGMLTNSSEKMVDTLTNPQSWGSAFARRTPSGDVIPLTNKEVLHQFKDSVGEDMWPTLQTAVQKNIVRSSQSGDKLNPTALINKLDNMQKFGALDLVPAAKELKQYATILRDFADKKTAGVWHDHLLSALGVGAFAAGHYGYGGGLIAAEGGARAVNALSKAGTPSLARVTAQQAGQQPIERKLATLLGRITTLSGVEASDDDPTNPIPEPPR